MRLNPALLSSLAALALTSRAAAGEPAPTPEAAIRGIYDEALVNGTAFQNLTQLVVKYPGRLSGSKQLAGAIVWATGVLQAMQLDGVRTQPVMVPHWERGGTEAVELVSDQGAIPLTAVALGGSVATPEGGLTASVVTVHTLDELNQLGATGVSGKIVFFDHPMDPRFINPGQAYGKATAYRTRGPAAAAKYGAVAALTRSLTLAHDDIPHTGVTVFAPGHPKIPAAALSWIAADRLAAVLAANPRAQVKLSLHGQWFPDSPAANVIGEIKGSAFPNQVILVGGHLDSWDIAPGANDDGAGVVQSIEVLRILQGQRIRPKHTVRCVLFVNEENGSAGADVEPLAPMGVPAGELRPDSQRYFDYHHTRIDTLDHVNPRELELGAAALASLVWLVDNQGL